jgi:hypothetical protein
MTINTQPNPTPVFSAANKPNETPNTPSTPPAPQDKLEKGPEKDDTSNVWKALRAVPSALAGAVIVGVGGAAATLLDVGPVTFSAAKALAKTPYIGTNLKVMTGVLLPFASVAAIVLSPIAGALYGLCSGFYHGAEKGIGEAISSATNDVKRYHKEVAGSAVEWLKDHETGNLPEGEKPYDVSLGGAAKGLVGGAVSGTIVGVAATGLALGYAVPGAIRAEAELWKSDIPLPFKVVATPVVPVAVALAAALAPAAGALYGLGMGAKDSYTKGLGEAVENSGKTIKDVNHGLYKAIFD